MEGIKEYADLDSLVIMMIGNKCDLVEEREVSREEAEQLAKQLGLKYFETSAKSGSNVEAIFEELAKDMIHKETKPLQHINATNDPPKKPIEKFHGESLSNHNMEGMLKKEKKKRFRLPC